MTRLPSALFALALAGCTAAQGSAWVPRLTARAAAVTRRGDDDARGAWSVGADLSFRLDPPSGPSPPRPPSISPEPARAPIACEVAPICAWERRARWRARVRARTRGVSP